MRDDPHRVLRVDGERAFCITVSKFEHEMFLIRGKPGSFVLNLKDLIDLQIKRVDVFEVKSVNIGVRFRHVKMCLTSQIKQKVNKKTQEVMYYWNIVSAEMCHGFSQVL